MVNFQYFWLTTIYGVPLRGVLSILLCAKDLLVSSWINQFEFRSFSRSNNLIHLILFNDNILYWDLRIILFIEKLKTPLHSSPSFVSKKIGMCMTVCKSRQPTYWITILGGNLCAVFQIHQHSAILIYLVLRLQHTYSKKGFFAVTSKLSGSDNSLKQVVLLCSTLAESGFSFAISIKSQDFEFAMESRKAQTKRRRDVAHPTIRSKRKRRLLKNKSGTLIAVKFPTVYIEGA